jgi:protein-disulfide isomerase
LTKPIDHGKIFTLNQRGAFMAKKQQAGTPSKRQIIREQRIKRQKQQRLTLILVVAAAALVVAGLLIWPSYQASRQPVGVVKTATPHEHPLPDGTALGNADAPVLIEVWEDFQCPACQGYSETIEPQVTQNYVATGKARYVFRHYPFLDTNSATKESHQAANASMCANEQGRFWDYHDILYTNWNGENEGAFSDKRLVAFAETIGLDMDKFNDCFETNRYNDEIEKDKADGEAAGVQGTPSVFVNGTIIRPGFVPTYQDISTAIEAALASQ